MASDIEHSGILIKQANRSHFPSLQRIELAAFETLKAMGAVTGDAKASSDYDLERYLRDGMLIVALDLTGTPIGFGGAYISARWLHIAEMDVHPNWQRKGVGRKIIVALLSVGRERKLLGATLTTDRLAPCNAPFYKTLGFRILEGDEIPRRLKDLLAAENANGLPAERRVAMLLAF